MSAALAHYLKDFSAAVQSAPPPEYAFSDSDFDMPALPEPDDIVDLAAEKQQSYDEGHAAAAQALEAAHADALEVLAAAHRDEIEALRVRYQVEIAERLTAAIREMTARIADTVVDATAQALVPILSEETARTAVAELGSLIRAQIAEGHAGKVKVRGPRDLFDLLSAGLDEHTDCLEFEASDDIDLTAELGDTVLLTRLSVFAESLERVMA
jgi:hypothetical protein